METVIAVIISPMKPTLLNILVLSLVAILQSRVSTNAETAFEQSFEPPTVRNWTLLEGSVFAVSVGDPLLAGSNFDGVDGSGFMIFGFGNNPGKIYFQFSTLPGQDYSLSYACGGTDTWTQPRRESRLSFTSAVVAYHGIKTVIDSHTGLPVEVEDLENLGSEENIFTVPGVANWRVYTWEKVNYSFHATSTVARVYFDTPNTTGLVSVGALDQVSVVGIPEPRIALLISAGSCLAGLTVRSRPRPTVRF